MTEHIVHRFDAELRQLHDQLMTMARLAVEQSEAALNRAVEGDTGSEAGFADKEQAINQHEMSIDEAAVSLIARRGPMASDLRTAIAFSKMGTDLERIGDEAITLHDLATRWRGDGGMLADLAEDTGRAVQLLQRAVAVLRDLDVARAEEIGSGQARLVEPFRAVIAQSVALEQHASTGDAVLRALAARCIERICGHACNLCEHVVYIARGVDVRHR